MAGLDASTIVKITDCEADGNPKTLDDSDVTRWQIKPDGTITCIAGSCLPCQSDNPGLPETTPSNGDPPANPRKP